MSNDVKKVDMRKVKSVQNFDLSTVVKHNYHGYLQHGIHRCDVCQLKKMCDRYEAGSDCSILKEFANDLSDLLYELPQISLVDYPLVDDLIYAECTLLLLKFYYRSVGPVRIENDGNNAPEIKTHSVRRFETQLRNQIIRLSDSLGLTPDSRRRMKVSAVQIMDVAARARGLENDN